MRRQLLLLNLEFLVDAALPASVQAAAPTTLEFLARCTFFRAGPLLLASMLCQPSNSPAMSRKCCELILLVSLIWSS